MLATSGSTHQTDDNFVLHPWMFDPGTAEPVPVHCRQGPTRRTRQRHLLYIICVGIALAAILFGIVQIAKADVPASAPDDHNSSRVLLTSKHSGLRILVILVVVYVVGGSALIMAMLRAAKRADKAADELTRRHIIGEEHPLPGGHPPRPTGTTPTTRLLGVVMMIAAAGAQAGGITLAWYPSPNPSLAGYRLYYGNAPGDYSFQTGIISGTSVTVEVDQNLTWYFAATAVGTNQFESAFSNEIVWRAPKPPVMQGQTCVELTLVVNRSIDGGPWFEDTLSPIYIEATNSMELFKTIRIAKRKLVY